MEQKGKNLGVTNSENSGSAATRAAQSRRVYRVFPFFVTGF